MKTVGFVGAGNMARALGGGMNQRKEGAISLFASDPSREALEQFEASTGGQAREGVAALLEVSEWVFLAIKPQILATVLPTLRPHLRDHHRVVSIVAGASLETLEQGLGGGARVIRTMPNTPALVGQGMTVLVGGENASTADVKTARGLFEGVGEALVVEDEGLLDAVTAVSGSGPGFLFAYAEASLAAARSAGLSADLSRQLVQQTIIGAAALWRESGESPGTLRERVTSPGGTTEAGLAALSENGFSDAVGAAIAAACARSRELADA